jgi:hypothetical protein
MDLLREKKKKCGDKESEDEESEEEDLEERKQKRGLFFKTMQVSFVII